MEHYTMTMMDLITTNLQKKTDQLSLAGFKFYLFGSSIYSSLANDIDILIEYDEQTINISDALKLRAELADSLSNEFQSKIDICLLSKAENSQTEFILKEKGILLPII
jgi:predicted nucleotidyltransferase